MVTVVDALNIFEVLGSIETLSEKIRRKWWGTGIKNSENEGEKGARWKKITGRWRSSCWTKSSLQMLLSSARPRFSGERERKEVGRDQGFAAKTQPESTNCGIRKDKYGDLDGERVAEHGAVQYGGGP